MGRSRLLPALRQGSRLANDEQARELMRLVASGHVSPNLSGTFCFDDIPARHQLMLDNLHPLGNMAVLVNVPAAGHGATVPQQVVPA